MNEIGKYLPIGTVVLLKGATKRAMITGFCSVDTENKEKMWDYAGCMFPEGFLSSDQTCLFDHEQIETIDHMGLIDSEEKKFKIAIEGFLKNLGDNPTMPETTDLPVASPEIPMLASNTEMPTTKDAEVLPIETIQ